MTGLLPVYRCRARCRGLSSCGDRGAQLTGRGNPELASDGWILAGLCLHLFLIQASFAGLFVATRGRVARVNRSRGRVRMSQLVLCSRAVERLSFRFECHRELKARPTTRCFDAGTRWQGSPGEVLHQRASFQPTHPLKRDQGYSVPAPVQNGVVG